VTHPGRSRGCTESAFPSLWDVSADDASGAPRPQRDVCKSGWPKTPRRSEDECAQTRGFLGNSHDDRRRRGGERQQQQSGRGLVSSPPSSGETIRDRTEMKKLHHRRRRRHGPPHRASISASVVSAGGCCCSSQPHARPRPLSDTHRANPPRPTTEEKDDQRVAPTLTGSRRQHDLRPAHTLAQALSFTLK
jgi:hypothetical protein